MTVTNRKMFNRGARNKVRQMGGIMASSEPLIQEVSRFQNGGGVTQNTRDYFQSLMRSSKFGGGQQLSEETLDFLEKRFGKQMPVFNRNVDTGVYSDTRFILGKDKGEGLAGIPFIRAPQQNVNVAGRRKEIPMLLAERERLVQEQRARKILGLAKRAGFNLNMPIQNKDDVISFVNQVDPSFNLTRQSFDKLFGAEFDPTIATKAGPTLGNVLRSLFLLPTAATLDVGKGIGEALFGDTKAYNKDELRKLISGEMKPVAGEKINLADAALDLYQRETSGPFAKDPKEVAQDIKNISGFDVNAMAAMKMRKAGDPSGVLGVLTGEGSGIQVKDPEGLMASERAGQPPGSMTVADSERLREQERKLQQADFRAAEDALMQSKNIVDPQSSQGADIQSILQALESAKAPGEREFRKQQEEEIYADAVARGRAEAADAAEAESEREFRKEQEKTIYEDAQGAEERAEIAGESAEALGGDPSKAQASYNNLGLRLTTGDAGADDPRIKRIMDEFIGNIDEYEGLDSGLALAKIGFMMAAGESPNALVNISNALSKGADMFIADDKKRKEFKRQVNLSALTYALQKRDKDDEFLRSLQTSTEDYVFSEATTYKGKKYKAGDIYTISKADKLSGALPPNLTLPSVYSATAKALLDKQKTQNELYKEFIDKATFNQTEMDKQIEGYNFDVDQAIRTENARGIFRNAILQVAEDGQVVGLKPALKLTVARGKSLFGISSGEEFSSLAEFKNNLKAGLQDLVPITVGGTQSANSISDRDVDLVIQGLIAGGILNEKGGTGTFSFAFKTEQEVIGSLKNGLRKIEDAQVGFLSRIEDRERRLLRTFSPSLGDFDTETRTFKPRLAITEVEKAQKRKQEIFGMGFGQPTYEKGDDGIFRRVIPGKDA